MIKCWILAISLVLNRLEVGFHIISDDLRSFNLQVNCVISAQELTLKPLRTVSVTNVLFWGLGCIISKVLHWAQVQGVGRRADWLPKRWRRDYWFGSLLETPKNPWLAVLQMARQQVLWYSVLLLTYWKLKRKVYWGFFERFQAFINVKPIRNLYSLWLWLEHDRYWICCSPVPRT